MSIKILTGASALYELNIISFNPKRKHVEMLLGTSVQNYNLEKYKITLQNKSTIEIGVIDKGGQKIYSPERLFVELNKYDLENTIKEEAIRNLEKIISPFLVKKYYDQLKKSRRGIDKTYVEDFLEKNLLNIKEVLKNPKNDPKTIIREYIMALISRLEMPICLIKGGSSVELFTTINRSTLDVDTQTGKEDIHQVIGYLTSSDEKPIYFKVKNPDAIKVFESKNKKVLKIDLIPVSKGGVVSNIIKDVVIPVSFNTTYTQEELKQIQEDFKVTKQRLRHLHKAKALIFTREMLLAEKYQSIISKPQKTKRTKDLIDLLLLWDENFDYAKFKKWLFRKWNNQRDSKNQHEVIDIIKTNKNKELTKIKPNFEDAIGMYELSATYEECLNIYHKITAMILEDKSFQK